MSRSGRERTRNRDADSRRRWDREEDQIPRIDCVFRLTDADRQQIAKCLRFIDDARRALEGQQNPDNREIVRELRASADRIFDLLNGLEEIDG